MLILFFALPLRVRATFFFEVAQNFAKSIKMGSGVSRQQESDAFGCVETLKFSQDERKRTDALSKLLNAAKFGNNRALLAMPSLGLVAELKRILREKSGAEVDWAAACLCELVLNDNNKVMLSSREMELMPIVMQHSTRIEDCFTIMTNILLRPENHDYLLSREVGLMQHVKNVLDSHSTSEMAKDE